MTAANTDRQRVLLLGGYGLIGSACLRSLRAAGHDVIAMGRSGRAARAAAPDIRWVLGDLTAVSEAEWAGLVAGCDVVVNAAGALQDGARDRLEGIHVQMIDRLTRAVESAAHPVRLIQISAAGVSEDASTRFFRTKARGDALVRARLTDWMILRPTLVLSPDAYGGTALLRAAAALPGIVPAVFPDSRVQTVHVDDVARAVCLCVEGRIAPGTCADLTETESRSLPDLICALRAWLGVRPARWMLQVPGWALRVTGRVADGLGLLGWRAPLRTTALAALADGVTGTPDAWRRAGGHRCRALDETLRDLPATAQERLFARAFFLLPLAIGVLSVFWLLSGAIALINPSAAMSVLTNRDAGMTLAALLVYGGAVADIALGLAILVRRWVRTAAWGMVTLSLGYVGGSVLVAPDLWADPLGPMVKVLPAMGLAALVALLFDSR